MHRDLSGQIMRPKLFLTIFFLLAWFFASAWTSAYGAAAVSTDHATVTLLSEQPQVAPGQTLWLGLRFELVPHWHVYWRNPGASGAAPTIDWILPDGWQTGDIQWSTPKRIRVGSLTNYGYEEIVTFLIPVQMPAGPLSADLLTIVADPEWLVCLEECIPESGRFTLELNQPGGQPSTAETRELFVNARTQWPQAATLVGYYGWHR